MAGVREAVSSGEVKRDVVEESGDSETSGEGRRVYRVDGDSGECGVREVITEVAVVGSPERGEGGNLGRWRRRPCL